MFRGKQMAAFLDNPVLNTFTQSLLAPSCIMYAYQSSSAPAGGSNYGSRIHVDCPRFIPNYRTNIGVILALDDFRPDNGGTRYLKGSHLKEEPPSEQFFNENCSTATCSAGDMIIFNARLYHATGVNNSSHIRHALTINFCRCFMRQRFDFCNMEEATPDFFSALGEDGKRLMGYNVRTPKTLDEFYLPEKHRLYKPGQE
jgi:ectoine hydroxylase-related dioxygenase (phytanoyl-CoA dioxygenase family)